MEKITIELLAQKLNLSKSTISRAFRDSFDINPKTKQRILEAAKELANIIRSNNINVVDEPHLVPVKSGLFGSKVTDESVADIKAWAKHVIDVIHQ